MPGLRVLIVDSDEAFTGRLSKTLHTQGVITTVASNGADAITVSLSQAFDLIVLDAALPKIDGLTIIQCLRARINTPIVLLATDNTVEERIAMFQFGADDYVLKPVNLIELQLRINVFLRRTATTEFQQNQHIDTGDLTLRKPTRQAIFNGDDLKLTPIQFRLLWVLVENRYQVMSKSVLYQIVFERVFSRDDRSLDMHLSRIRKKLITLGMAADRLLTIHGKGYKFS